MSQTTIEVETADEPDGWTCRVTLTDGDGRSEHRVRVRRGDLERFAPDDPDAGALVRRSIEFLLEREPRSSILPAFDLPAIGRYFPEYERVIGG
jgi:hypothetical protein